MPQEQASLNDSIEEDEEERKASSSQRKKKKQTKKQDKNSKKVLEAPTPQTHPELDPVELMPNLKLGSKERRQQRRIRNNRESSSSDEDGNQSVIERGRNALNRLF
jgi:hypothetical protein